MLRWYSWFPNLAVMDDASGKAFALSCDKGGWREVNSAEVGMDGTLISESDARSGYAKRLSEAGDPPITSRRQKPRELTYSPVLALAMARAAQRIGTKYDDPELAEAGKKLEKLAQDKIDAATRAQRAIKELKRQLSIS